jgi:uncharacterized protein YdeI (YjbR/CyaY-like superfamily)
MKHSALIFSVNSAQFCPESNFMGKKDHRIDAYIAQSADFAKPILQYIRRLVHAGCPEVEETMKWSMPHFLHKGMLCNMAAFKQHCSFGFWKGELILGRRPGGLRDEGMGHFGRISATTDLPGEKKFLSYIRKAAELNEAGVKKPAAVRAKVKKPLVIPPELAAALKRHPKAAATFNNFSPSHRKEYIEWITEAKREETRRQRLETTVTWLTEGKSRHWKYSNC